MKLDYRSPDLVERLAEREQALAVALDDKALALRELAAARGLLRKKRVWNALRTSGIGALAGNVAGGLGWALAGSPWFLLGGSALFTLLAFVLDIATSATDIAMLANVGYRIREARRNR